MFCYKCGTRIGKGQKICPDCGASQENTIYCNGFWGLIDETALGEDQKKDKRQREKEIIRSIDTSGASVNHKKDGSSSNVTDNQRDDRTSPKTSDKDRRGRSNKEAERKNVAHRVSERRNANLGGSGEFWRMIAAVLGILCIILLVIVLILRGRLGRAASMASDMTAESVAAESLIPESMPSESSIAETFESEIYETTGEGLILLTDETDAPEGEESESLELQDNEAENTEIQENDVQETDN